MPNLGLFVLFGNYGECLIKTDHATLRELGPKKMASLFIL